MSCGSRGPIARLWNADLAPTRVEQRTWTTYNMASLWVGLSVCIPTYMLAAGLVQGGMSWWQAMLTILLGNLIVLVPMVLIAHPGTRFGIPFPVLARASFGTRGANVPAILRGLVACGWFGIQTWIGGQAIHTLLRTAFPAWERVPGGVWIAFFVFWLMNIYIVVRGSNAIKRLEAWAAPFLIVAGLALLAWAALRARAWGRSWRSRASSGRRASSWPSSCRRSPPWSASGRRSRSTSPTCHVTPAIRGPRSAASSTACRRR